MLLFLTLACTDSEPQAAATDLDGDGWPAAQDCADDDASVHPFAAEPCDGVDNDCDEMIDDGAPEFYPDVDGDGVGAGAPVAACEIPASGYSMWGGDCDDADPAVAPSFSETPYNDVDDDCDPDTLDQDLDGDGVDFPDDCDDLDHSVQTERNLSNENLFDAEDVLEVCGGTCPARGSDVTIGGSLTSAAGLECLTTVEGELTLSGALESVEALTGLVSVAKLRVKAAALESLVGLEQVPSLEWLIVEEESALTSLRGLDGLQEVTEVYVRTPLASLEGLGSLTRVGLMTVEVGATAPTGVPALAEVTDELTITSEGACVSFPSLVTVGNTLNTHGCVGWAALQSVGGTLVHRIDDADFPALLAVGTVTSDAPDTEPLAGLPVLERLEGEFSIEPSVPATPVVLPASLRWLGELTIDGTGVGRLEASPELVIGDLTVTGDSLADIGSVLRVRSSVTSTADDLSGVVADDGQLALAVEGGSVADIEGLVALDSLRAYGWMVSGDFGGLEGVTRIDGDVTLEASRLTSLAGLENVESIGGDVTITFNAYLTDAAAWAWVDAVGLANIGGTVTIESNG